MSKFGKIRALVAAAWLLASVGQGSGQTADVLRVAMALPDAKARGAQEAEDVDSRALDEARSAALEAKAGLTGYQARKVDSIMVVIDSFQRIDRLFQANAAGQKLTAMLPRLKEDEVKAARLKSLVPGEWLFTDRDKSVEDPKVNAVRTTLFKFGTDGKVQLTEKKSGRSSPFLKEDWHFESWGTYGYKGDTIMLSISRFASVKQVFSRLHRIDGKDVWKDEPGPVFDSLITDGSQDRYVTYEDLKEDFKKVR